MRQRFLFYAMSVVVLLYLHSLLLGVLFILFMSIFHLRHFKGKHVYFIALLIFMQIRIILPVSHELPQEKIIRVDEIKANYIIGNTGNEKVILYDVNNVSFDDILKISGDYEMIEALHNRSEFYFPQWAQRKGIQYSMNVQSIEILEEGTTIRSKLYDYIQSLDEEYKSFILSTIYGIHEEDVFYMVSSSGMHISYISNLMYSFASLFFNTVTSSIISILFAAFLGFTTVMSTTVKRLLCFRIVALFFPNLSAKDNLGLGMLILMVIDLNVIYELGFVIPVCFRFVSFFNIAKISKRSMSLLILIPIQFYFFQTLEPITILGFALLRNFFAYSYIAALLACLPFLQILIPFFITIQTTLMEGMQLLEPLYYHPTTLWVWFWIWFGFRYLTFRKRSDRMKLALLFLFTQYGMYLDPFLHVDMLDIGQGDTTLITLPFHQGTMLIDVAGSHYKNIPKDVIYPILRKKGIQSLDKVVITHDDFDHSGGLSQLQELMDINEIITDKQKTISLNEYVFNTLLFEQQYEDKNENSLILFLDVFDKTFLFMGDAGISAEQEILKEYPNLQVDVLKAGHHGSKTSSSLSFLHQLDPTVALISCGRNNRYGHPSKEVIENMQREDIYPLITAEKGEVEFFISKYLKFYKTADGEFGIMS